MNEKFEDEKEEDLFPEVEIAKRKGISIVWLIPLTAAIIGGWLAFKTVTEKGPTITIAFKNGGGLEAGKTKIKFKAVEVGLVETIEISSDLTHVLVTASMNKSAEPHLTEGTRFWVVRPRIKVTGVSGLETLVSGPYIEVEPGPGPPAEEFKGLDEPPVLRADSPGRKFLLQAEALGSVNAGSPVNFRGIKVGEVLGYEIAQDKQSVLVHIFIDAPYDKFVHANTKFWNLSGIDVSLTADGVKMKTQSLETLLAGGVAFETPVNDPEGMPAKDGTKFRLYKSYDDSSEAYKDFFEYIMYFNNSVRGLKVGSPVEFRGIKIGSVSDVRLEFFRETTEIRIPVLVRIETGRVTEIGGNTDPDDNLKTLVKRGLRARLQTGSLLTGQLFIQMDFYPDKPAQFVRGDDGYLEIPTIPSTLDEVTKTATEILADLRKLPLDELINNLIATVKSVKRFVDAPEIMDTVRTLNSSLNDFNGVMKNIVAQVASLGTALNKTTETASTVLEQGQKILVEVEDFVDKDSPIRVNLNHSLEEISAAARSLRILADYLERHPEVLLRGKGESRR